MLNLKRLGAAVTAFLALVGGLTIASPAQAAKSDCMAGYVCLWTGSSSYSGSLYQWTQGYIWQTYPSHCMNLSGYANNSANSIMNNGGRVVRFNYDACGVSTVGIVLNPGQSAYYTDGDIYARSNRISSIFIG